MEKLNPFVPKKPDIAKKPTFRDTLIRTTGPIFLKELPEESDPNWELGPQISEITTECLV